MNFEDGKLRIEELEGWAAKNDAELTRNEAQTRFDLIDRIVGALAWPQGQIHVEKHRDQTYTDYELGRPASRLLIEAKREGISFSLPAGWSERLAKISTVVSSSEEIDDAIRQALGYALMRGIPYAAVSNGWQLVAFLASRTDGIAPLDGQALVFSSLSDMRSDFRTLWDNLSIFGIQEDNLRHILSRPRLRPNAPRLAQKAPAYPGVAHRHENQQTLQILGSVFVEDLAALEENERRFLISCYSHSGALSQYAVISKEILRTRYSLLFDESADYEVAPASTHTGLDPNLLGDIAAASLKQRPIILLGDVGVGKSTFIRNLIHVEARQQLEQAIVFYLDFGKRPAVTNDLSAHVIAEIVRQLREEHSIDIYADPFVRGVYHGRLEQFKQSIFGPLAETAPHIFAERELEFLATLEADADEHLKASLSHISRAHRKQIVVFLDNVDQRDAAFQEHLFVIAQTMAESWPVTVFLALRPETFYESKRAGSLSAYQPRAFTISPPRVEVVLSKRLNYALELLRDGGLRTSSGVEISIDLSTLILYMQTVQRSLQMNAELIEFLENVSNGNIRDALGYLETYIGSPHVNLKRMLEVLESGSRFTIPLHDLARSVLLGDGLYYDPTRSPIANIFDIESAARAEHFLMPLIIEFMQVVGANATSDGFVEIERIYDYGQRVGFSIDSIQGVLKRGIEARFITRAGLDRRSREEARAYRVTSCGVYVTTKLAGSFTYLDAIIDDTPIVDADLYATLNPMAHNRNLDARLRRVERFVRYLDGAWTTVGEGPRAESSFDWGVVGRRALADVERITERSRRNQGERSGM